MVLPRVKRVPWLSVGLVLAHRRKLCPIIKPTSSEHLMIVGEISTDHVYQFGCEIRRLYFVGGKYLMSNI